MSPIKILEDKISTLELWENHLILERNEYLAVKDKVDTNLYFVVNGSLRVFLVNQFEEHTIRFGYKNNFIAALDSYITENPSELYIQAIRRTEVKVIGKKRFMTFIEASSDNLQLWHEILGQLIFQQMQREQDILISSPLERYNRVLKRSPQLFQEIPNKYIASYLRMAPETLSRIKKY